jgi:hypothetical protein
MGNLFLQAKKMSEEDMVVQFKRNRVFSKKLVNDLKRFFNFHLEITNNVQSTSIWLARNETHKKELFFIFANKDKVKFCATLYGYSQNDENLTSLGRLYEKYSTTSVAEKSFLEGKRKLGNVTLGINIPFENYDEVLRDIMQVLEMGNYKRK